MPPFLSLLKKIELNATVSFIVYFKNQEIKEVVLK